jgi:Uncharacterized conserved protein (DUF2190)
LPTTFNIDQAKGKNASGPIIRRRFVKLDTTATDGETVKQCDTLGEGAYGVSLFSTSSAEILKGKGCSVITDGRAVLEAAAAIAVGAAVTTDAVGRAITAVTGNQILGYCDEPATALGNDCSVMLGRAGVSA